VHVQFLRGGQTVAAISLKSRSDGASIEHVMGGLYV
jgi:hypothetical protein